MHRFSFLAINISNIGRALPSLGVLAILLPIVGIGKTDVIIALVVLAFPPILTNTYVAVDQVDAETVDAAKGIGLRPWQVLLRVELPLALPLIFAGIRTSAVFVIATATLAGFFGGGGLGDIISNEASYGSGRRHRRVLRPDRAGVPVAGAVPAARALGHAGRPPIASAAVSARAPRPRRC